MERLDEFQYPPHKTQSKVAAALVALRFQHSGPVAPRSTTSVRFLNFFFLGVFLAGTNRKAHICLLNKYEVLLLLRLVSYDCLRIYGSDK